MKVLIYSRVFAPNIGGVETVVMSLASGLARMNKADTGVTTDLTVVTMTPRHGFDDAGLPFPVVRQPKLRQLVRLIRATDVLHLAGPSLLPLLSALLLRKPVAVEHHGFQAICPNGQLLYEPTHEPCPGHFMANEHMRCLRCNIKKGMAGSLRSWLLTFPRRFLCARVDANVMPTVWLQGQLKLPGSTTVHHGLSAHIGNSVSASQPSTSKFAFIGRLVSTKGVYTLVQAAQQLRVAGFQFQLKVIGNGPDRDALWQQIVHSGLEDSVHLLGYVPPGRLDEQLAEVATIIIPSLAGEVFGMVAAEGMSRGKLLIASDIGSMREVIGEAGLFFPAGNAAELAKCMKRVLNEPNLFARHGNIGRTRASHQFDETTMVSRHLDIYREALACDD